jgi:uncharacterized protein (TIGR02118 family)
MIKISIFYPNKPGARFDFDYYINTHMPLAIKLLSAHPGFKGVSVEKGLGGGAPDAPPTYIAMCHFLFDSLESFLALQSQRTILRDDLPNYTDIESIIQISEVVIGQ